MKSKRIGALFILPILTLTCSMMRADTFPYQTAAWAQVYPLSTSSYLLNYYAQPGPSYYSTSGGDTSNGQALSYSGSAEAGNGVLHSESQFSCVACTSAGNGIGMGAAWYSFGVNATSVYPASLSNIASYAVTWNIDGTVSSFDDTGVYAFLDVRITQNGVTTNATGSTYYTSPLGPVTFYLQPGQAGQPFDFVFWIYTQASTNILNMSSGESNFYNTASFTSLEALDANGNVIPGVSWELSDGTLLGQNGITPVGSPTSTTPEPSTLILFGTGLIGAAGAVRRRLTA